MIHSSCDPAPPLKMQIIPLVLVSWRTTLVNTRSLVVNTKSALAQAKASSNVFIGINSNYSVAYSWFFFTLCCHDDTHGRCISRSVSTLQWAITMCYCLSPLCLSPRNYVWPPVWKPVYVQRGGVTREPSPNYKPQFCLDRSTCGDGLRQLHVRIHAMPMRR